MSAANKNSFSFPDVLNKPFPDSVTIPLQQQAAKALRKFQLPETKEEWEKTRKELYEKTAGAMRLTIDHSFPLSYEETATIKQEGYCIKTISFMAEENRCITGNLYIPDGEGPFPAILNVHGHWTQGKIAARVQARGHILAQRGYVCLSVDAFGAGERSSVHGQWQYHGLYRGASTLNVGETLMGLQVADNMRAIDLLQSLPFVDKDNIGVTGASGGGNQTMYIAAMDERVKAAVPVCSVGSFDSYVRGVNCYCELLPGGLLFTEEAGIIALVAPRAIKICNTIDDEEYFSPKEMLGTFNEAGKIFRALDAEGNLVNQVFAGGHGYWPEILESMVAFFDLHLKKKGNGISCKLPDYTSLPEEKLMVWEKGKNPEKLISLQTFVSRKATLLARKRALLPEKTSVISSLEKLLISPKKIHRNECTLLPEKEGFKRYIIDCGSSIIPVLVKEADSSCVHIIASGRNKGEIAKSRLYGEISKKKETVLLFEPYGSGETCKSSFSLSPGTDYHNLARYCAWLGFSMLGIWVQQYMMISEWAKETFSCDSFTFSGVDDAGAAAIFAALFAAEKPSLLSIEKCVTSLDLSRKDFSSAAATLALTVPDILCYGDLSTAVALSGVKTRFIDPVYGDGTLFTREEKEEWKKMCNRESTAFCGKNCDLTMEE